VAGDQVLDGVPVEDLSNAGLLRQILASQLRAEQRAETRDAELTARLSNLEAHMSRLDDAVDQLLTVQTEVVADLRAKLEQAKADDTIAAEVAADVEENIAKLDEAAAALRGETGGESPAEPGDGTEPTPGV
jgi:chromosome segregation ATPase